MKITILVDNTPCPENPNLISEHGLSMLIEYGTTRILCDMGLGISFWKNAEILGIDLTQTDTVFLSHGHKDHSGGLMTFLRNNDTAPVYLSPNVFHHHFYTSRHLVKRDISTDSSIQTQYADRLHFIDESCWLTETIAIVRCHCHQWSNPFGNTFLTSQEEGKEERADLFDHELSLAFNTLEGLVIISSCSHNGALNIIQSCKDFTRQEKVHAFVGGLHFVDCDRTAQEVATFEKDWNQLYSGTMLYTGHCTSDKAKGLLKNVIPHFEIFHTGEIIHI